MSAALGGGTVRYEWNRDALRGTGLTVLLEADLGVLAERVRRADRPRVTPGLTLEEELQRLWSSAEPIYRKAADLSYRTDLGRDVGAVRPHRAVRRRVGRSPPGAVPRDRRHVDDVGDVDGQVLGVVAEQAMGGLGGAHRSLRVVDGDQHSSHPEVLPGIRVAAATGAAAGDDRGLPRLRRDVALKVLPADVAADPSRRARFEQEAHAAAALNHPNILGVHDVGLEKGVSYILTELVNGEDEWFLAIDGRRTIEEILRAAPRDGRDQARALSFFERLWHYDQIVFDASGQRDPQRRRGQTRT